MIFILWMEELKCAMRGRFAWIGAGALLLAVGALATAATQDTWLDSYGIIAYGLAPLAFIPLSAGMIASARASRFVECVFTAPVSRGDWLIAKVLVLLTLAGGYYVALLPMMFVYQAHIGIPLLLHKFLLWTPGLLVMSVMIGSLIGVLFIGRSLAAPAGAGMGLLMFYAGLMPLQELLVARGNGATRSGHLVLASPAVLLKNALGFTIAAASIPGTVVNTWISIVLITVFAGALAIWLFLRAQGVETWEATPPQRWAIGAGLLVILLLPMALADTNYDNPAPPVNNAPAIRGLFGRNGLNLALTRGGADVPSRCCSPLLNRDFDSLPTDRTTTRDLLLLFPVETSDKITGLQMQVTGDNHLDVTSRGALPDQLESHSYPNDSGPAASDGHHIVNGWVARVPVALRPGNPWDIGGNRYPLTVHAAYSVNGQPHTFVARAAVEAQVPGAIYEMGVASLLFPCVCFGASIRRWRRSR